MLNMLSKKLKRQLKLLERLFEGGSYRFADLEKILNCSSKTIKNDLLDIQSYANGINVKMDRKDGISVTILPHVTEDYIYQIIMNESIEYRYLEVILLNNYSDYLELADYLFVSESTLRRMAEKINGAIQKYGLEIQRLVKMTGDDQTITALTVQFLMEKYQHFENAFSPSVCQLTYYLIQTFIFENNLEERAADLDPKEEQTLFFMVASKIVQIENGIEWNREINKDYSLTFKKVVEIGATLPISNKILTEKMLKNIFEQPFLIWLFELESASLKKKDLTIQSVAEFIDELENEYQMVCEEKKRILRKINMTIQQRILPFTILYEKNQSIFKNIQPEIEKLRLKLKYRINKNKRAQLIKKQFIDHFTKNIVEDILLYWPELLREIEKNKQVRALVVTNSPSKYNSYLIKKLEHQLGNRYEFIIKRTGPLSQHLIQRENIDCIISNLTLNPRFSVPIFGISIFPNTREIHNLIHFHQQLLRT
ncbi:hypothetical protein A5844_000409 [Enterococcus sp. 10A9_DIV0425]|uniref:Mga helix-turn-helix domain-containing protein n=1 Tax=Candidatus Enterococcus wittei TaxID=1987383 RepID=A0A2C9XPR7_9ENTE|nr:helix-turn-helix domain-containing protein [Enterococcus sp. 10A9_DIV0425]OTP12193.1 hypothetical protein A5844_000409 [Enterococcus sp. 10A9_DIV0425]